MRNTLLSKVVAVVSVSWSLNGQAYLIDFENIPGVGLPTEGLEISSQFEATAGVSFSLEGGGFPVIAEVGSPETAFTPNDTPLPGQGTGQFFLTDDGVVVGNPKPLIVTYSTPVSAASGFIIDIDGASTSFPEIFTVEALDATNALLDSIVLTAGDPGTGDQVATPWSFQFSTNSIQFIRIDSFREGDRNLGLAFDLFNTDTALQPPTVPEPPSSLLMLSALLPIVVSLRNLRGYSPQK